MPRIEGIRRVTQLINEISTSSSDQRVGIGQINHAVSQMEQSTQQNAARGEPSGQPRE
ncbi:MAG TPA: hypothetical protein VEC35_09040 [Noviherbaspirillum sp.]|nr:hypothetical protein [Noviherbaspirillum sp.]